MPRSFWLTSTASSSARLRLKTTSPAEKMRRGAQHLGQRRIGEQLAVVASPTKLNVPASTFHSCSEYQNTSPSGISTKSDDADELRRDEQIARQAVAARHGPERRRGAAAAAWVASRGGLRRHRQRASSGWMRSQTACITAATSASGSHMASSAARAVCLISANRCGGLHLAGRDALDHHRFDLLRREQRVGLGQHFGVEQALARRREELRQLGRVLRVGEEGEEVGGGLRRSCPGLNTPMPAWPITAYSPAGPAGSGTRSQSNGSPWAAARRG